MEWGLARFVYLFSSKGVDCAPLLPIMQHMSEDELTFYPIPDASSYEIASDGKLYRLLKGGKRKKLKTNLYHRKGKKWAEHRVKLTFDDGKRKYRNPHTLRREAQILAGEQHEWLPKRPREIGSQFIELPDLWCMYLVDHGGTVYKQTEDAQGTYFHEVPYYLDESNRVNPIERVNLRDPEFRPRTFTRKQLKEMQETRMDQLVEMRT